MKSSSIINDGKKVISITINKRYITLAPISNLIGLAFRLKDIKIKIWDIRFSNLCNMACRSCGTWFSSNWYEDHKKIHGSDPGHPKIMRAGRSANDIWEQLLEQFDHVEQFYFAGGEPIICLLYTSPSPRDQRGSGKAACG